MLPLSIAEKSRGTDDPIHLTASTPDVVSKPQCFVAARQTLEFGHFPRAVRRSLWMDSAGKPDALQTLRAAQALRKTRQRLDCGELAPAFHGGKKPVNG